MYSLKWHQNDFNDSKWQQNDFWCHGLCFLFINNIVVITTILFIYYIVKFKMTHMTVKIVKVLKKKSFLLK